MSQRPTRRWAWVIVLSGALAPAGRAAPPTSLAKCDAPSFRQHNDAYPNAGSAYCVPTAAADGIAWLAEHGLDRLSGRDAEEQIVSDLAAKMGTDPSRGTSWGAAADGLTDYLDDYYEPVRIRVGAVGCHAGGLYPNPDDFAWVQEMLARPDTVVIIQRKLYLITPNGTEGPYNGHAMFLAGSDAPAAEMILHDPLVGPHDEPDPVALVEHWRDPRSFLRYTFDIDTAAPDGAPPGSLADARWTDAIAFGVLLHGDANGDAAVDAADLALLGNHYGGTGAAWDQGDFNLDGAVDVLDLALLANRYDAAPPAAASPAAGAPLPEPIGSALLLLWAPALVAGRRRRR